ncbi:MAG: hypothetical protein R3B83_02800 [Nitrospirales bacterium]|nr:hypothetical protein [Nitrospirales bacterium]
MAAVIRGAPPVKLRDVLQGTIESIHAQYSDALRSFQGCLCVSGHPVVIGRLVFRCSSSKPGGLPFSVWVLAALLLGLLGWWGYHAAL